jgi:hypothetical protein
MNKNEVMAMMKAEVGDNLNIKANANYSAQDCNNTNLSCWKYWDTWYYPQVIRESYPVYVQERAEDKGKKAFEIIKMMKDKNLIQLKTVADFIEAMDALIKVL